MASWWSVLFLAVAVASNGYDLDYMSPEESNEVDRGVENIRPNSLLPPRACRSWCSCAGQYRSSYCCPTGIPSDSMCGARPNAGRNPAIIHAAGDGQVMCSGSYCGTPLAPYVVHRPADICSSRMCRVLVDSALASPPPYPVVSPPRTTSCTTHADCGEDVCCSYKCTTIEACARMRLGLGLGPRSRVLYAHGGVCDSDMDCSNYGSNYICCGNQCKTRATCSPRVVTDTSFY